MTNYDWKKTLGSQDAIKLIAERPHLFGHIVGMEKLVELHSEWIRYAWDSNIPRALQAFRGGYKTTSICVLGSIRWLLFNPNDRIAIIRKHFGSGSEVVNAIATIMDLPQIQEVFKFMYGEYARFKIRRDGYITFNFKKFVSPEPSILALGIDSEYTGKHFDKIIADDFVTLRDRISRAERWNTKMMVMELATNIINPGKGSSWIGTPWHKDDAWRIVNAFCPIAKYPIEKFNFIGDEEVEKKRQKTTPALFAANYSLSLITDKTMLFQDPLYPYKWDYSVRGAVAQLDTAFDGDHYCALTIAAPTRREGDNQFYQAVGFTYAGNIEDWEPEIEVLLKKYYVKHIWVESNADKGASGKRLNKRGVTVKSYSEGMNKHVKIGTYLYMVWKYIEWSDETDDEYMAQVVDYKEGAQPDDAPDSAASLFKQEFLNNNIPLDDDALAFFHGMG